MKTNVWLQMVSGLKAQRSALHYK